MTRRRCIRFFDEHRVAVPVFARDGRRPLRVSIAPYNDDADVARLVDTLDAERALPAGDV